jgi:hypothetical protein
MTPDELAEMAKRPKLIHLRDRPHRYRESDLYRNICDYAPLPGGGSCDRRKSDRLHRE